MFIMKLYGRLNDRRTLAVRAVANLASGNNDSTLKNTKEKGLVEFISVGDELKKGISNTGKLPVLHLDGKIVAFSSNACVSLLCVLASTQI